MIITTEKDAVRLINNPYFPHALRKQIMYLPVEVEFVQNDDDDDLINLITNGIAQKMRQKNNKID